MQNTPANGFHLHGSSHLELLARELARQVQQLELEPLQAHVVLVPTPALARWLDQAIALENGISCRIDYLLPGNWLWQLYRKLQPDLPAEDPLSRENLPWRLYSQLLDLPGLNILEPVRHWVQGQPPTGVWDMALQLGDLFDRYQYYRPDWLLQWAESGRSSQHPALHWQAWLWQRLRQTTPCNRPDLLHRLPALLDDAPAALLPSRLDCFALPGLPTVQLEILHVLSRRIPIHFWQFQPSEHYWQDLAGDNTWLARQLETEQEEFWLRGHPLLMDWGQRIRTLDRQIWQLTEPQHQHLEPPSPASTTNLLHALQADIRQAERPDGRWRLPAESSTVEIHCCHTPMRECELLRDHLLHLLQTDPSLEPEDILVMTSDMRTYGPFIQAVLTAGEEPQLACNLSDLPAGNEQPLIRAFVQWLGLPNDRLGFNSLWMALESHSVRQAIGLDENALQELRRQIHAAGARWGLDEDHRRQLGLPGHPWFSWQWAADRLLLGQVMDEDQPLDDLLPIPMREGNQDRSGLAALITYLQRLRKWLSRLAEGPRTARDWATLLGQMLTELSQPTDEEQPALQDIHEWLESLAGQELETPLPLEVLQHQARRHFQEQRVHLRQYSGGITVCGLRPLRGVPFRIICLLGMDDERFPRRERKLQFDGMHLLPRSGDPSSTLDERSLMLETLMAARDRLWISYSGRDPVTNESKPAALPVRQLLQALGERFTLGDEPADQAVFHEHPLHGFLPQAFSGRPAYGRQHFAIARALQQERQEPGPDVWPHATLPELPMPASLQPVELLRFFRHPTRQFLRQRLGIELGGGEAWDEDEPLDPSSLQHWQLKAHLLEQRYRHETPREAVLISHGLLPPPPLGRAILEPLHQQVEDQWPALPDSRGDWRPQCPALEFVLDFDDGTVEISGPLPVLCDPLGIVVPEPGQPHLGNWVQVHLAHLLACATGWSTHTLWLRQRKHGGLLQLPPIPAAQARERLRELLKWYRRGLNQALPFLPRAGWAWLQQTQQGKEDPHKIDRAFVGSGKTPGDLDDPWIAHLLQHRHWRPATDPSFIHLNEEILRLLEVTE